MNIIYLRVSTEEQNPKNQLKDCESLLNGDKYTPLIESKSAFKDDYKRIKFKELQELIKQKKVKKIIVWDLDRIYRNRSKLREFFEYCKYYNVCVLSFRQPFINDFQNNGTSVGGMMLDLFLVILGWLSEEESAKKSERVKIAYKNHKGKKWGRQEIPESLKLKVLQIWNKEKLSCRKLEELNFEYKTKDNKVRFLKRSKINDIIREYKSENKINK